MYNSSAVPDSSTTSGICFWFTGLTKGFSLSSADLAGLEDSFLNWSALPAFLFISFLSSFLDEVSSFFCVLEFTSSNSTLPSTASLFVASIRVL